MRVFTDGSCIGNGKAGAKAGYAVWFPENREWSVANRVPDEESQTNQRAELSAIAEAVRILLSKGCEDSDIVIYTDSDYSIKCLTVWITKWVARGWKTIDGKDVLHQDLIKEISGGLSKFKSHRFHHVRAHTGGEDDLSINNDKVDQMARGTIDDSVKTVVHPARNVIFEGCPLELMGPSVPQTRLLEWIHSNLGKLDKDIIDKYLYKAFSEICTTRDVKLVKQTIQKRTFIRAEVGHLQISHPSIDKVEE